MRVRLGYRSFLLATIFAFFGGAPSDGNAADPRAVFRRPLIVDASVSRGFFTAGPGTRLARRFTDEANIVNIAVNGKPGSHFAGIDHEYLAQNRFSVVIGVDYLYWDSVQRDPAAFWRSTIWYGRARKPEYR